MKLLITCEHGGNEIPQKFRSHFKDNNLLKTHRGVDFGALELAKAIAKAFNAPLIVNTTSRLLIEFNRSLHHKDLFYLKTLTEEEKQELIRDYYLPYRKRVEEEITRLKPVFHLSVHSFTPIRRGEVRRADIGLLYDPKRSSEKALAKTLAEKLKPDYHIRMNYPYLGTADGLTTALRKEYRNSDYAGIELEVNQKIVKMDLKWKALKIKVIDSLHEL